MEFLKRHYEKIILSVVLVVLAIGVALLPMQLRQEKEYVASKVKGITAEPKKYQALNTASFENVLNRTASNSPVVLSGAPGHNTFNPVLWQVGPDGTLYKNDSDEKLGFKKLELVDTKELRYIISLEKVSGNSYLIGIIKENAVRPADRQKKTRYFSKTSANAEGLFKLTEVKGAAENPEALVFELADTKEQAVVAKDKPFIRVDEYLADLKYDPEKRVWKQQRKGNEIGFNGDAYKIMDIKADEVLVFQKSSGKQLVVKKKNAAVPEAAQKN